MRNIIIFNRLQLICLLISLFIVSIISCDSKWENEEPSPSETISRNHLETIEALGYDITGVEDVGHSYLVEGGTTGIYDCISEWDYITYEVLAPEDLPKPVRIYFNTDQSGKTVMASIFEGENIGGKRVYTGFFYPVINQWCEIFVDLKKGKYFVQLQVVNGTTYGKVINVINGGSLHANYSFSGWNDFPYGYVED